MHRGTALTAALALATVAPVAAAADATPSRAAADDGDGHTSLGARGNAAEAYQTEREQQRATEKAMRVAHARFAAAVFDGWERANPAPEVGDRVAPGKGYRGQPLPSGAVGTVRGSAPGQHGCWLVDWERGGVGVVDGEGTAAAPLPSGEVCCYGNGTYEMAVLSATPGLPGVDVVERVPEVEWTDDPSEPFSELAAHHDEPLLLRNTAAKHWRAHDAWQDLDALLANVSILAGVKVNRGSDVFAYYHRAPMNAELSMVEAYKESTFTKHGRPIDPTRTFFPSAMLLPHSLGMEFVTVACNRNSRCESRA